MSHRLLQFTRVFYFYLPAAALATPSTVPSSEENASQPSQAPFLSFSHEDSAVRRENGATEEGSRANGNRAEDEGMSTNIDIVIRLSMPPDGQGNQNHATTEELVPFLVSQIQQLLNNAGNAQTVAENPGNAQTVAENPGNAQDSTANPGNAQAAAGNSQTSTNSNNSQIPTNTPSSQNPSTTPPSPPSSPSASPKPGGVKRSPSESSSPASKRSHYHCFQTNTLLNHINLQSPHRLFRSPAQEAGAAPGAAEPQRDCWADGQGCA